MGRRRDGGVHKDIYGRGGRSGGVCGRDGVGGLGCNGGGCAGDCAGSGADGEACWQGGTDVVGGHGAGDRWGVRGDGLADGGADSGLRVDQTCGGYDCGAHRNLHGGSRGARRVRSGDDVATLRSDCCRGAGDRSGGCVEAETRGKSRSDTISSDGAIDRWSVGGDWLTSRRSDRGLRIGKICGRDCGGSG